MNPPDIDFVLDTPMLRARMNDHKDAVLRKLDEDQFFEPLVIPMRVSLDKDGNIINVVDARTL